MKKSIKKAPDRIILFETGTIIALLFVNWVLHLSYMPSDWDPGVEDTPYDEPAYPPVTFDEPEVDNQEALTDFITQEYKDNQRLDLVDDFKDLFEIPNPLDVKKHIPKREGLKSLITFKGPVSPTIIDSVVQFLPEFPGGHDAMARYVQDNFKVNSYMSEWADFVLVRVSFVVRNDGSITDIKTMESNMAGMGVEREAERVIASMPKWEPAYKDGRAVNFRVILPIRVIVN